MCITERRSKSQYNPLISAFFPQKLQLLLRQEVSNLKSFQTFPNRDVSAPDSRHKDSLHFLVLDLKNHKNCHFTAKLETKINERRGDHASSRRSLRYFKTFVSAISPKNCTFFSLRVKTLKNLCAQTRCTNFWIRHDVEFQRTSLSVMSVVNKHPEIHLEIRKMSF